MLQPIRTTFLFAASMVMGLAALMNATAAVPHLHEDLVEINVRPTLLSAVLLAMHFTSFAMFAFTLIVLFAAIQSWRGTATPTMVLAIIAAMYLVFGIFAFAWSRNLHTLGYGLIGLLIFGSLVTREK